jgi:hypothetical protein
MNTRTAPTMRLPRRPYSELDDIDDLLADDDEELRAETVILHQQKAAPPRRAGFDSRVWLKPNRMTQTEASLRLAVSLLNRRLVESDVIVALTGGELTRASKPRFPVIAFLRTLGYKPADEHTDWRTIYTSEKAEFGLRLHNRIGEGDVVAQLRSGNRLAAEVCGGPLEPTRSPTEHRLLRAVVARALTAEYSRTDDVLVAVVPRSERFRALARRWEELPRVAGTGISIVLVDRLGQARGCAAIDS